MFQFCLFFFGGGGDTPTNYSSFSYLIAREPRSLVFGLPLHLQSIDALCYLKDFKSAAADAVHLNFFFDYQQSYSIFLI